MKRASKDTCPSVLPRWSCVNVQFERLQLGYTMLPPTSVQFRLFSLCHVFSRAPLHGGPSAGRARPGPRSGLPGGQSGSPPGPGIRGAGGRARSRPAGPCLAETPATGWAGCCKVSLADYSASGLAARPGSDSQLGHNAGRAGRTPWSVLTHHRPDSCGITRGLPFPRSRMPASIEKSLQLVVCLQHNTSTQNNVHLICKIRVEWETP